jgi:hypothetical protein
MLSYSNWSVLTASFMVVLYLSMSSVALCAVLYLVGAKWRSQVRQFAAPLFTLFPVAFVLLLILLLGADNTFPWIGFLASHGEGEVYMPGWYTLPLLATREVVGMLVVMALCWVFIKRQAVSERSEEDMRRFHKIACWIPFFYVLYATMVAWDFEMTLRPEWHSAIYGMQNMVSNFGMFLSFLLIWIYVLNTRGVLVKKVDDYVYNYIAQMMLAFTLLWMYTFFAQYLTIWYGNLADERDRIDAMQDGDYSVLWWSMIALKFVIPFASLCFPVTRHNVQATVAVACCIIVGTLFERYNWISGIYGVGTIPLLTTVVVIGVLSTIGYMLVRGAMRRNHLIKG